MCIWWVALAWGGDGGGASTDLVSLDLQIDPPSAAVYIGDELHTERPLRVPRSEDFVRLRIEAQGRKTKSVQVQPSADRRLEVKLKPAR